MKVGDYVRYKYENCIYIGKIKFISEVMGFEETLQLDIDNCMEETLKEDVIKSSPNIIDLIEVGDYVNGCLVTNKRASTNERLSGHPKQIFILKQEGNYYDGHFEWLGEENIKSIVTKEQFENCMYKVGD